MIIRTRITRSSGKISGETIIQLEDGSGEGYVVLTAKQHDQHVRSSVRKAKIDDDFSFTLNIFAKYKIINAERYSRITQDRISLQHKAAVDSWLQSIASGESLDSGLGEF